MSGSTMPPGQVDNIYEFSVTPGLFGAGGDLDGTGNDDGNGGTVTAIGTMGSDGLITYTSVPAESQVTIDGTYLNFSVDSDFGSDGNNSGGNGPIPSAQAVIDAIQANENAPTPLSDTFYYQVTNLGGTTTDSVTLDLNDVETNATGAPYTSAETIGYGSTVNIGGYSFDKPLATGQSAGADQTETLSVTLSLQNNSGTEGMLEIDPNAVGHDANTGETVSFDANADNVTITGQIQQINADLQGLTYIAPNTDSDDSILQQATDGPAQTADFYIGEISTSSTGTITNPGMPQPIANTTSEIFTVNPPPISGFGSGLGDPAGDTIISVSTDDINFTMVSSMNGGDSTASVDGTYLNFAVDATNDSQSVNVDQDNQSLIDQIQANDNVYLADPTTPPLSDTFYYQLVDPSGDTITNQVVFDLDDFYTNATGAPYTKPTTALTDTTISVAGFSVDKFLASDQTTDASDIISVTLGVFDFAEQHGDGTFFVDSSEAGSMGAGATVVAADSGITISGSIGAVNADLSALKYITADTAGQEYIIFGDTDGPVQQGAAIIGQIDVVCYLRGTRILSPTGQVNVEDLKIGDPVVTRFGGVQPIKWIGRQNFAARFVKGNRDQIPVRIGAGALGKNLPARDLFVSPGHSMLIDGQLILAKSMVNGVSIAQDHVPEEINYYQIEFEAHDCVLAEGSWSESFADGPGLRNRFHNAAAFSQLYPDYDTPAELRLCAPRPEHGPALERALRGIIARAGDRNAGPLQGYVDLIAAGCIEGWAHDTASPEFPVLLEIVLAGVAIGTILACDHREDLMKAGIGQGRCSFSFKPPTDLPPDQLGLVQVRRAANGAALQHSAECSSQLKAAA